MHVLYFLHQEFMSQMRQNLFTFDIFCQVPTLPPSIAIDHNYCVTYFPGPDDMPPVHARGVISNIDDIIDGVVQVNA